VLSAGGQSLAPHAFAAVLFYNKGGQG